MGETGYDVLQALTRAEEAVAAARDIINMMRLEITKLQESNKRLQQAVGLLNSMVEGGEYHTDTSREMVRKAML